jgi:hypothetical protein
MTREQQLEHRLAMIQDDLNKVREFISEHELGELFYKPSKYADWGWTHLNNIEIACDINTDESLTWKLYGTTNQH